MKLGIFIDPLATLKAEKDTTLLIIERANALGWECFYFTPADLFFRDNEVYASLASIKITDLTQKDWAEIKFLGDIALSELDIILFRIDPPVDTEYLYATQLLQMLETKGVLISNKVQSLRDVNEKLFTLQFSNCCTDTIVSSDIKRLRRFWEEHKSVVFKPLDGMGGKNIFHVAEDGRNLSVILEILTSNSSVTIVAQRYIPEIVTMGDKRIILINGEPVPYALARMPTKGELRGNLAAGGIGKVVEITARDRWICEQIAPTLKSKGLHLVGIDVIGDYLTEINVTSPTCMVQISHATGLDIATSYLQFLEYFKNQPA